jgi:hypothetical protein
MDALSDPEVSEVGLQKPVQCGATEIGLDWTGWIIDTDPDNMLIIQPDRVLAENFVKGPARSDDRGDAAGEAKLKPVANANNHLDQAVPGHDAGDDLAGAGAVRAAADPLWLARRLRPDGREYRRGRRRGRQGSALKLLEGRFTALRGKGEEIRLVVAGGRQGRQDRGLRRQRHRRAAAAALPALRRPLGDRPAARPALRRQGHGGRGRGEAHVVCGANGCILEPADRRGC